MLRPLRAALGTWSPRRSEASIEPLAAIVATWPEIVGKELARAARPSAIAGDTLVVVTASSAWSHQLSFLAPQILAALADLPQTAGIARLRFRVGRLGRERPRRTPPPLRRHERMGGTVAVTAAPAATIDEALQRLRRRFTDQQDAKRAHGWKPCERCAVLIEGGTHCAPCAAESAGERALAVQRVMYDAPWLGYGGTAALIDALTVEEYERNRHAVLERWWTLLSRAKAAGRVSADGHERRLASAYVLLQTGWEPDRITPPIVRNILGDELMHLLYEH